MNKRMFIESQNVYSLMPQIKHTNPNNVILSRLKSNMEMTRLIGRGSIEMKLINNGQEIDFVTPEGYFDKKNERIDILLKCGLGKCFEYTKEHYEDLHNSIEDLFFSDNKTLRFTNTKIYTAL